MKAKKIFNSTLYTVIFFIIFFLSTIISFRIILKGEMVTIPDLVGKTMAEAKITLAKKSLAIANKGEQYDTHWEKGRIIFQDPPSGSKVKFNKEVKVILSSGKDKVTIPRLMGKSFQLINQALKDAGIRKGKVSQVHTSDYSAGKIFAQNPQALEEVGRNFPVSLLVSQGEEEDRYLMPDLIGKNAVTIIAKLKELDFRVENVRYTYYPGLDSGIIIKQQPLHGYLIQKNYPINLEVSK